MLLSHILVYAPSAHSRSALYSKNWLEITQDFTNMLYKHIHLILHQLLVNHDGVFRLHRTNTKFIPDNRTTPVILFADTQSCIPLLIFRRSHHNNFINPSWNQDALDRTHKFLKNNSDVPDFAFRVNPLRNIK